LEVKLNSVNGIVITLFERHAVVRIDGQLNDTIARPDPRIYDRAKCAKREGQFPICRYAWRVLASCGPAPVTEGVTCRTKGTCTSNVCLFLVSGKVTGMQTGENADGNLGAIGPIVLCLAT